MASHYQLVKDYLGVPQSTVLGIEPDQLTVNPYWIIAVYRFSETVTFARLTMSSFDADPSQAVNVNQSPLVITSDCIQMQVEGNKASYQGGLQAMLTFGEVNYLTEIFPGDWVAAWILNSEDQAQDVIRRIYNMDPTDPCNNFLDGFKFLGRVQSIRKVLRQTSQGLRTVGYSLQAHSFKEFDATIFYDKNLAEKVSSVGDYLGKLGANFNNFLVKDQTGVDINKVMPFLLDLMLGTGVPQGTFAAPNTAAGTPRVQIARGLTQDAGQAPYSYLIPESVGALIGKVGKSKAGGILCAADIDEILFGIQNYSLGLNSGQVAPPDSDPAAIFIPDNLEVNGNRKYTNTAMLGIFVPDFPELTNNSVWTVLSQYLNPAVNEMYTAMRANENGNIVPTMIVRQIPFTTDVFADSIKTSPSGTSPNTYVDSSLRFTRFLELPRWQIHPIMVQTAEIGRSDAQRFNFVHIYGQAPTYRDASAITNQIVENPPIQDLSDIKRSGLRPLQATVACAPQDFTKDSHGPRKWMALSADIHMGMHLTLNGTINCIGIQAPIVWGDNLEFDGVVYHIESVLHTCQIENGNRSFYTTLQVSHGIRSDTDAQNLNLPIVFPDQGIFPGLFSDDNTQYDPGLTYDGQNTGAKNPSITTSSGRILPDDGVVGR
jgi:hypothetical protein